VAFAEATYEQETLCAPFRDAVTVTVKPLATPGTRIAGVASLVMSSEFDEPVSDAAKRFGNAGAAGGVASIVSGKVVGADTTPPIA
jgi:hypothetical protein